MEFIRNGVAEVITSPSFADKITGLSITAPAGEAHYVFKDEIINPETLTVPMTPTRYISLSDWTEYYYDHIKAEWVAVAGTEGAITLPHALLKYCGDIDIVWSYEESGEVREDHQQAKVYEPLFTHKQLVEFDSKMAKLTVPAVMALERMVRGVVEGYTGQKFEMSKGVVIGRSHKPDSIVLPKRIISTTNKIKGIPVTLESDGWIIRANGAGNVDYYTNKFYENTTWSGNIAIEGVFGYATVPSNVNLAALILAQDYGCKEASWRDKYVANLKNSDWRVEFNERTWNGTGNVKADQMLNKYKRVEMVVI